jgi:hypothetical protein
MAGRASNLIRNVVPNALGFVFRSGAEDRLPKERNEMSDELIGTIDGRCGCKRCVERTQNMYRMVSGPCSNCHTGPFLMLFRSGDTACALDCPACGNWHTVRPGRAATADEIPAAVSS